MLGSSLFFVELFIDNVVKVRAIGKVFVRFGRIGRWGKWVLLLIWVKFYGYFFGVLIWWLEGYYVFVWLISIFLVIVEYIPFLVLLGR